MDSKAKRTINLALLGGVKTVTLNPGDMFKWPVVTAEHDPIDCRTCHDPHRGRRARLRAADPDRLCGDCHEEDARALIGAHDFTHHPGLTNARGLNAARAGKCGFCHAAHLEPAAIHERVLRIRASLLTPGGGTTARLAVHDPLGFAAELPLLQEIPLPLIKLIK